MSFKNSTFQCALIGDGEHSYVAYSFQHLGCSAPDGHEGSFARVGWALDENNKDLISDDMKTKIDAASADIVAGKVSVHDYRSDNTCPAG